jgi:integrase
MGTITEITTKKQNSGKSFRAEVRRDGVRITKCFARKTDARNWISEREAEIRNGLTTHKFKKYSVSDAITKYCREVLPQKKPGTRQLHAAQLEWFNAEIGALKLHKINTALLSELREKLRTTSYSRTKDGSERPYSASTVNRYFVPFIHCLKICCTDWEWLDRVPKFSKLKEPKGRTRYLTQEEANTILNALEKDPRKDVALVCLLALTFGSRLGETCALKWENIDFKNRVILFTETKTGEVKNLPVPDRLYASLAEWKKQSTSDYLFPTSKTSKRPYIYDKVRKPFAGLCKKLGLKDVTFHNTRHTVGSWATQDGHNRKMVAELLGHKNLQTTDRYSHLDVEHLRPLVEGVEGRLMQKPTFRSTTRDEK